MTQEKPKLLILSDLWGKEKSSWVANYINLLQQKITVIFYDCCELGEINKKEYSEENLHKQFVSGGIETAVQNLLISEKDDVFILAFSIGGTIAWKSTLLGLKTKALFAISATRLRVETEKPATNLSLFYGRNDIFKPDDNWFAALKINKTLFENENHNFYEKPEYATKIAKHILQVLEMDK